MQQGKVPKSPNRKSEWKFYRERQDVRETMRDQSRMGLQGGRNVQGLLKTYVKNMNTSCVG